MSRNNDEKNRLSASALRAHRSSLAVESAPASVGGPGRVITALSVGTSFAVGKYVKCVGGAWSLLSDVDSGPLVCGVVVSDSGAFNVIQVWGIRAAAGTAGAIFYAAPTAGESTTTPPVAEESVAASSGARKMELQVEGGLRFVCPDLFPQRLITVVTCENGVETTRNFLESF